jgi:glycosyltransferase involved in cell wall biosynthesis
VRILIVTHAPLLAEAGAGQIALNLAAGLRSLGHDVVVESLAAAPLELPMWRRRQAMRAHADSLAVGAGQFDIIDCPETLLTPRLRRSASRIVARSVQPALLYLAHELGHSRARGPRGAARALVLAWENLMWAGHALQGWRQATCILSLGARERDWMGCSFPWWRGKLSHYVVAPSEGDQEAFAALRRERDRIRPSLRRFLWVGRWSPHKGTKELVAFVRDWAKRFPKDSFTIAGCGGKAIDDIPSGLVASGQVRFVPSFQRPQLCQLLAEHDAGLFTSRVEGWGLVLNEMLESGLTVFATPAGATRDLQPFFPHALKSFPPEPDWQPPQDRGAPPEEYYKVFNWRAIAGEYVSSVSSPARTHRAEWTAIP